MARVQFKGKDEDASVGGGNKYPAAPRGIYTLQISDYEAGKTGPQAKNPGVPMYKLTCEIAEGSYMGTRVYHNLTLIPRGNDAKPRAGHGIAVHLLHALGMEAVNGTFDFDDEELQARQFTALLEVDHYDTIKDGKTYHNEKNIVREVYTAAHPAPATLPAPKNAKPVMNNPVASRQSTNAGTINAGTMTEDEVPF